MSTRGRLTCVPSIREFCEMKMPILMFDQNQDYVPINLEHVGHGFCRHCPLTGVLVRATDICAQLLPLSFGPEQLQAERRS